LEQHLREIAEQHDHMDCCLAYAHECEPTENYTADARSLYKLARTLDELTSEVSS
jgi:hypothetical protein